MDKYIYKTILEHKEYKIPKIKWSIFIGNVFHIENKEDIEKYLAQVEKKYPDARHHCYAYRYEVQMNFDIFGTAVYTSKYHKAVDAGEPTSTAGKPIINMIEKYDLHNVLVVVSRYFWGTLLGVGGLIQAYGEWAKQVIEQANIIETEVMKTITFSYPFDLVPIVRNILNTYDTKIVEEKYDKEVEMKIKINSWYLEAFKKEIADNSKGQIKI